MPTSGSVSEWIEGLKTGDSSAATHLWNRYHYSLMRFTRRRIHDQIRRVADEEDLVATTTDTSYRIGRYEDG